jgi:hypothetical protein
MQPRFGKCAIRSLVTVAGFALWCLPSSADNLPQTEDQLCSLTPGLQGRIEDITAAPGVRPAVNVERDGTLHEARVGCLLRAGDIVRPRPGTKVAVMLPNGEIRTIEFNQAMVIPQGPERSGAIGRLYTVLRELAGADVSEAREKALGTIGATRSANAASPPIMMPGMLGLGQQYVENSRPLYVRWKGGVAPFRIEFSPARTSTAPTSAVLATTSERFARLDLSRYTAGDYALAITAADQRPLTLRVRITTPTEVPSAPQMDPSADEEALELLEAVWLLTQAPSQWRLEALSRLETLAREHDNLIAQVILDPALAKPSLQ